MREIFCKYMVAEKGIKLYSGLLTGHKARVYASKGRVDNISENIAGSNFSTTFTYDEKGRLKTRTHPSGITETNNYNSSGYLASISAGGSTRYTVIAMNVRQQITAAYFGVVTATYEYNQYGYPAATTYGPVQNYRYSFNTVTGNLNWRKDSLRSLTENFTCDNLDRLKTVTGPQNLTMDYAANGNILTKSDVGNVFGYEHPTKPYALTGVETSTGLIPDALQTFAAYTSFEQPAVITESPYQATFTYNSEGQRAKMEVKQSGNTILTRWYVGSRYMKETSGGVTKEYTWIGGDAYSAPVAAVKQGSTTTYYAVLRDYLGNITNVVEEGDILNPDKYSFDAWGRRRNPANWSYSLGSEPALFAGRGFTSHEWLPWFNLYNMNGRLYDPIVGRFLSADNYVQAPGFTQSFNRYSYCLNNPLIFTDPSGEKVKWWQIPFLFMGITGANYAINDLMGKTDYSFGQAIGHYGVDLAAFVIGAGAGNAVSSVINIGGFLGGMVAGASGGYAAGFVGGSGHAWMNGADFMDGYFAGVGGGITNGLIGGGIGGLVGGFSSMSQQGNFWDGNFRTGPSLAGMEGGGKVYGPFSIREITVYGNSKLGMGAVRNASWVYGMSQSFIRPYQSNGWERFRDDYGIIGKIGYSVADDFWVTTQRMVLQKLPSQVAHLSGSGVEGAELLDAGINTLSNTVPMGSYGKMLGITRKPLNAAQFNKFYKGTGINSATNSGYFIRQNNYMIRNSNNFSDFWNSLTIGGLMFNGY